MVKYRIEVDKQASWFYRLVCTSNGQTLLTSESYKTGWGAKRAAKKVAAANNYEYKEVA